MKISIQTIPGIEENVLAILRKSLIKFSKRWAIIGMGLSNNGIPFSITGKLPNTTESAMNVALKLGTSYTWVNLSLNETPEKFGATSKDGKVWSYSKTFTNVKSISLNDLAPILTGHKQNDILVNFCSETSVSIDLKLMLVEETIDSAETGQLINSDNYQALPACSYGIYPQFRIDTGSIEINWDVPDCFQESCKNILLNLKTNLIKFDDKKLSSELT